MTTLVKCSNCGKEIPKDKAETFLDMEIRTRHACDHKCKIEALIKQFGTDEVTEKDILNPELRLFLAA